MSLIAVMWISLTRASCIGSNHGQRWGRLWILEAIKELGRHVKSIAHGFTPQVTLLNAKRQSLGGRLALKGCHAPGRVAEKLETFAALLSDMR